MSIMTEIINKIRSFILLILGLLICFCVNARQLSVGNRIPDKDFRVSNYKNSTINLAHLKGKLVLLDFWSHSCLPCLRSFPKLDSLQKAFGDQLQIILINGESETATKQFFEKHSRVFKPGIPMISGNTLIQDTLLPHHNVPYLVWIDSTGIIRHMTEGDAANSQNIKSLLYGGRFFGTNYHKEKVATIFDANLESSLQSFSYFTKCINGFSLTAFEKEGFVALTYNCVSVETLFKAAFTEGRPELNYRFNRTGRIIFEGVEPGPLVRPSKKSDLSEWKDQFAVSYQLMVPLHSAKNKFEMMKNDLARNFGLRGRIETRKLPCWVMVRTSNEDKLKSGSKDQIQNFFWADEKSVTIPAMRTLTNTPYSFFSQTLQVYMERELGKTFEDVTGYSGNIDIEIKGSVMDSRNIDLLRKELQKYDLDLIEREWPIEVLVIHPM